MSFPRFVPDFQKSSLLPANPANPATNPPEVAVVAAVAGSRPQNQTHSAAAPTISDLKPAEAVVLVGCTFPGSKLIALEPRRHGPTDDELPPIEQSREPDGSLGPRLRLAMERGAAVFGEWPLPQVKPGDYALPNHGKRSGSRFYRVLPGERVFCLNSDGLPSELISRGAIEGALGEIARNPRRAERLFVREHKAPPPEWSTRDDVGETPAVRAKLDRTWPETSRHGWKRKKIFGAAFWPIEARGLAAVLDEDDRVVDVSARTITVEKADAHRTQLRFQRSISK